MNKTIGKIIFWALIGVLLIYSASRTVHLIGLTLGNDDKVQSLLALAAFDGGLLGWSYLFLRSAEGQLQRAIALIMTLVSLLAVIVAFGADTIMQAGTNGVIDASGKGFAQTIIYVTCAVIASHIAAGIVYHIAEPENLMNIKQEAAKDKIAAAAMKQIDENSEALAQELAPQIGAAWVEQMRLKVTHSLAAGNVFLLDNPKGRVIEGTAKTVEPAMQMAKDEPADPKS